MRIDDALKNSPTELMKMGYPSLEEAFAYPNLLAEAIQIFLDRDILCHYLSSCSKPDLVINSTDQVDVTQSELVIHGRCWDARKRS